MRSIPRKSRSHSDGSFSGKNLLTPGIRTFWTGPPSRHTLIPMKHNYSAVHPKLRFYARFTPKVTYNRRNVWLFHRLLGAMRVSLPSPGSPHSAIYGSPAPEIQAKLRLRIYQPEPLSAPTGAILWLHGGGYVMGKPEQDDRRCMQFVRELGLTVVSVDYRIAPQFPFPSALDDSYLALQWMASYAQQLGIDPARIAAAGASAGGGLAAALAQLAHDRKDIQPAFQLLIFPMLDDRTVGRGDNVNGANVIWNQKSNRFGWESYLGMACAAAKRCRNTPCPPAAQTSPGCRRPGSVWGRWIYSMTNPWPTPKGCRRPVFPVSSIRSRARSTALIFLMPRLPCVRDFRESQMTALSQLSKPSTAAAKLSPRTSK